MEDLYIVEGVSQKTLPGVSGRRLGTTIRTVSPSDKHTTYVHVSSDLKKET